MRYVTSDFGVLSKVEKDSRYVWITNTQGDKRKISIGKYKESADKAYSKALKLVGEEVRITTSQNTKPWDISEWFSDIHLK